MDHRHESVGLGPLEPWRHLPDLGWMLRQAHQYKIPLKQSIRELVEAAREGLCDATVFCYLPRRTGGIPFTFAL